MTKILHRVFRTHARKLGGHFHVRVFSAVGKDFTFGSLGELVMDAHDYMHFIAAFRAEHIREEDGDSV